MEKELFNLLSESLCYPEDKKEGALLEMSGKLKMAGFDFSNECDILIEYFKSNTRECIEEDYTRTFDMNAVCPLEIGYILFGEDYKRGEFLVRVSELHEEYETKQVEHELADYLPSILRLIPLMKDGELKKDFIEQIVLPALKRMLEKFSRKDKDQVNPFSIPIRISENILSSKYTMNPTILEACYE